MSYQYGLPASLSGPCLETTCDYSAAYDATVCGSAVVECKAGSISFSNPVDPESPDEQCSYTFTDDEGDQEVCELQPLSGTLDGYGGTWSLYDAFSTITITADVVTVTEGETFAAETILFAGEAGEFLTYFLAGGSELAAGSVVPVSMEPASRTPVATTPAATTPIATTPVAIPRITTMPLANTVTQTGPVATTTSKAVPRFTSSRLGLALIGLCWFSHLLIESI